VELDRDQDIAAAPEIGSDLTGFWQAILDYCNQNSMNAACAAPLPKI
jgi:hypothetical protein